jgi:hypothetical protein
VVIKEQVMPLLLEACPSFRRRWEGHLRGTTYQEGLLYVHLGMLADHLVDLLRIGDTSELRAVFDVVERLHVEGEPYVREAATMGLLEGLQNVAGNRGVDPAGFVPSLKPESAKWWAELNEFWEGKVRFITPT